MGSRSTHTRSCLNDSTTLKFRPLDHVARLLPLGAKIDKFYSSRGKFEVLINRKACVRVFN